MRFKNFSREIISVPYQMWVAPKKQGHILLSMSFDPGEITQDFDPSDPIVQRMLQAHPELRPVIMATAWERVLAGVL